MESTPSQGVLINVARFAYALVGFSLSVITAFLSLFHPRRLKTQNEFLPLLRHPGPLPPASARIRRPQRTLSDHSVRFAPLPPSAGEKELPEHSEKEPIVSVENTWSPVLPFVVLDPSIPTSADEFKSGVELDELASELSQPPPYTSRSSTSSSTISSSSVKSGFRLFRVKSLGKDGKDRPQVERRRSSPHIICQGPLAPLFPGLCNRPPREDSDSTPLKNSKSRKSLRSAASLHGLDNEKTPSKRSLRKTEKKRAQVLRTHPYEAPYFCTPPSLPSAPVHRQSFFPESGTSDSSGD